MVKTQTLSVFFPCLMMVVSVAFFLLFFLSHFKTDLKLLTVKIQMQKKKRNMFFKPGFFKDKKPFRSSIGFLGRFYLQSIFFLPKAFTKNFFLASFFLSKKKSYFYTDVASILVVLGEKKNVRKKKQYEKILCCLLYNKFRSGTPHKRMYFLSGNLTEV